MPSQLRLRATLRQYQLRSQLVQSRQVPSRDSSPPPTATAVMTSPSVSMSARGEATADDAVSPSDDSDDAEATALRRRPVTKRRRLSFDENSAVDVDDEVPEAATLLSVIAESNTDAALPSQARDQQVQRLVEPALQSAADIADVTSPGRRAGRTKVFVDGYEFTRANTTRVKITYRCSYYRSQACKARMYFYAATLGFDVANMIPHTCTPPSRVNQLIDDGGSLLDLRPAMQQAVDHLALAGDLSPHQIWMQASEAFLHEREGNVVLRALTKNQVIKRVHNVRARHYGSDMHGRVEVPPLSRVLNSNLSFFQFHHIWHNPHLAGDNKIDRVIGWAHPSLLTLLRYNNVSLFIDGTFRCVPAKFRQCVVVMVYDNGTKLYVPVCYVLAASKTYDAYWNILQYVSDACGEKIKPKDVVCDFESALIGAVQEWFDGANVVGCFFHFKQACQRRMIKYRIPKPEVSIAMEKGVLDMLTVVDKEKVSPQGIAWVKAKIRDRCLEVGTSYSSSKWRQFWAYFRRTWIRLHPPSVWNIHGLNRSIVARTNNPLERFNRELNAAFATPHPSVPRFVHTIESISRDYVRLRDQVSRGLAEAPPRQRTLDLPTAVVLPETVAESDESSDDDVDNSYEYHSDSTDGDADLETQDNGIEGDDDEAYM